MYLQMIAKNQRTEAVISGMINDQINNEFDERKQQNKTLISEQNNRNVISEQNKKSILDQETNNKIISEQQTNKNVILEQQNNNTVILEQQNNEKIISEQYNSKNFITQNCGVLNVKDNNGFSCPRCGNTYTRTHSLNRHVNFECGIEPKFQCPICQKKSKHKHNLLIHMRTHKKQQ